MANISQAINEIAATLQALDKRLTVIETSPVAKILAKNTAGDPATGSSGTILLQEYESDVKIRMSNTWLSLLGGSGGGAGDHIHTTDQVAEGLLNFYHTDTRVSNNSDVSLNTANRHTHGNKSILDQLVQAHIDHKDRTDNPHAVTAPQITIGVFQNSVIAESNVTQWGDLHYQPLDATLTALAALDGTPGLLTQTGVDTFARRSLAGSASISISNANGQAGNPAIDTIPSGILADLITVDGSGSGLDADKLDGFQSTQFLRSDVSDQADGQITFANNTIFNTGTLARFNGDISVSTANTLGRITISDNSVGLAIGEYGTTAGDWARGIISMYKDTTAGTKEFVRMGMLGNTDSLTRFWVGVDPDSASPWNDGHFVITSSGNVGINEIVPTYKLEVNGTTNITGHLTGLSGAFSSTLDVTSDFTVGANVLFVDESLASVGINTNPDPQFALDVLGPARASIFVGSHAIQLKDAIFLAHFDGNEKNTVAEFNDVKGKIATETGGVSIGDGKFNKAMFTQKETLTNLWWDPMLTDITNFDAYHSSASIVSWPIKYGDTSVQIKKTDTSRSSWYVGNFGDLIPLSGATAGRTFTATVWFYASKDLIGTNVNFYLREYGGSQSQDNDVASFTIVRGWQKLQVTKTIVENDRTALVWWVYATPGTTNPDTDSWFALNGLTITESDYAVETISGNLPGCSWTGTEHDSTSTRVGPGYLEYDNPGFNAEKQTVMFWFNNIDITAQAGLWQVRSGTDQTYADSYLNGAGTLSVRDKNAVTGNIMSMSKTGIQGDTWYHVAIVWEDDGSASLYVDGVLEDTDATTGHPDFTTEKLRVGAFYDLGNSYIDDFVIIDRPLAADEVRAIYESNAPVFAETSAWSFRSSKSGLVWADEEGLWMRDAVGNAAFGLSGVDGKSWGGKTLDGGDLLVGRNNDFLMWDSSTATLTISGDGAGLTNIDGGNIQTNTITATQIQSNTITLTELNFTPVQTNNVIASINASVEGITIDADNLTINASTTFATGYDPTDKIDQGGAAADVNNYTTTINGGQITTNSITSTQITSNEITVDKLSISGTRNPALALFSEYIIRTSGLTYQLGVLEDDTKVWKYDVVDDEWQQIGVYNISDTGSTISTLDAGERILSSRPLFLLETGQALFPFNLALSGQRFMWYNNRATPTLWIYALADVRVEYSLNDPTFAAPRTATISSGSIFSVDGGTWTELDDQNSYISRLKADGPICVILSGGIDQETLMPASKRILSYTGGGKTIMSWDGTSNYTIVNNGEADYVYSSSTELAYHGHGDGGGSASDTSVPIDALNTHYIVPHGISNFGLVAIQNVEVNVYEIIGGALSFIESISLSGSETNPALYQDLSDGTDYLGGTSYSANPTVFIGDGPFLLRTNQVTTDDEYHPLGYNAAFRSYTERETIIDGNTIITGTVLSTHINVTNLSAINVDMGTLTAGRIEMLSGSTGLVLDKNSGNNSGYHLAGFNSGVLQAGIEAATGKFLAGAGNLTLDENGIQIESALGTNYDTKSSIDFVAPGQANGAPAGDLIANIDVREYALGSDYYTYLFSEINSKDNYRSSLRLQASSAAMFDVSIASLSVETPTGGIGLMEVYSYNSLDRTDAAIKANEVTIRSDENPILFYTNGYSNRGYIFVPHSVDVWNTASNKASGSTEDVNNYGVPTEAIAISCRLSYKTDTAGNVGYLSYAGYMASPIARVQAANIWNDAQGIVILPSDGILTFITDNNTNDVVFQINGYFI